MKKLPDGFRLEGFGEIHASRVAIETFSPELDNDVVEHITGLSEFGLSPSVNNPRVYGNPILDIFEPSANKVMICLAGLSIYGEDGILKNFIQSMFKEYESSMQSN